MVFHLVFHLSKWGISKVVINIGEYVSIYFLIQKNNTSILFSAETKILTHPLHEFQIFQFPRVSEICQDTGEIFESHFSSSNA